MKKKALELFSYADKERAEAAIKDEDKPANPIVALTVAFARYIDFTLLLSSLFGFYPFSFAYAAISASKPKTKERQIFSEDSTC